MALRDHQPIVIEEFGGLWQRGGADSVPLDHLISARNVTLIESGLETRPGLDTFIAKEDVLRMYNYKTQEVEGLLILTVDGQIFHSLTDGSNITYGPILTIIGMTDFGYHSYNGRAYITPFNTLTDLLGREYQLGLPGEFVYVYKGDGTAARKAAGFPPSLSSAPPGSNTETFKAFNSRFDGIITKGVHLLTVLDNAGNNLVPVFPVVYAPGNKEIELTNIPTPLGATSRTILMTHAIDPKNYVPDQSTYTYYEALVLADNTTTTAKLSIRDANLTVVTATGVPPITAALQAEIDDSLGFADIGFHLIAVVYETDTGYRTALGPENFASINVVDITKAIRVFNIPVSPDSFVVKRHLVATRAIANYNGDQRGYQFYFIPEGTLEDNVTTELVVSFYDLDLLEDASHLIDNFSEIPAGVFLNTYKSRMVLGATYDDSSLLRFSAPGEPEAIDQVDGNVIVPLDGKALTNFQEFRDVGYATKQTMTYAVIDNGLEPSEWPAPQPIDQGIGASVHGICKVLDSDGVNIDFLLMADYSGLMIFNGAYSRPELTYKIIDLWFGMDRDVFSELQIMNNSLDQLIFISLPDIIVTSNGVDYTNVMLVANYRWGMDPKNIKWAIWTFDVRPKSIAIVQTNVLVIGN